MENKDILLSIIIPIYNREKTVGRIIDGILSVKSKKFELILVNDGSTDNSENICNEYTKKDERVILINKENGGVSSARNCGIDNANGKYLYFCDSDDDVITETLENALEIIKERDEELFIFDYQYNFLNENRVQKSSFKLPSDKVLNKKDIVNFIINPLITKSGTDFANVWNKFFSLKVVKENNIRFEEKVFKGEDWRFLLDYLDVIESAVYVPEIIYIYNIDGSQVGSKYKRLPGIHLFGSKKRKLILSEKYKIDFSREKRISQYRDIISDVVFSVKNGCDKKELRKMLNDEFAKLSAKEVLKVKKEERLNFGITKRCRLYAFCVKHKMVWLIKLFA